MTRTDIINKLISDNCYDSYLEIGVPDPKRNYEKILCKHKECVDPLLDDKFERFSLEDSHRWLTYRMTSDEMFKKMPEEKKYDIIFIDGLHLEDQVDKDIFNSLKHLKENGYIVVHDCLPKCELHQVEDRKTDIWNGSVWKSMPKLSSYGIKYLTVDADYGCGIIQYGKMDVLPEPSKYTWKDFAESRDILMHVVSEKYFMNTPASKLFDNMIWR